MSYLRFSTDSGNVNSNTELLELSGITGTLTSVSITLAEDMPSYSNGRYLLDGRRLAGSGGGFDSLYLLQDSATTAAAAGLTSNPKLNGTQVTAPQDVFNNALAGDVISLEMSIAPSAGVVSLGARNNEVESAYGLAISGITVVDSEGSHVVDFSSVVGDETSVDSNTGGITATLYNFPNDDSHWIDVNSNTLEIPDDAATHGTNLTATSSITDATSAKLIDSSANELALTNFVNVGGGSYTFSIPALSAALVGVIPSACTIEITNGTDTASDTITLEPLSGYTQITAGSQAGGLTIDDWGFVGVGGLDNAATSGDIVWTETVAGVTDNSNGTTTLADTFTGGTVTRWLFDLESLIWTVVTADYLTDGGAISAQLAFNTRLQYALGAYSGTLNDRLQKYLRAEGHTGALNDMIFQAGGWQQVLSDLGVY